MPLFSLDDVKTAAGLVYRDFPATPQIQWPLLSARTGTDVWVKHENHTPAGAFKIRGGITFIDWLKRAHPDVSGIVTATRGNHGQSQARAATRAGLTAKIYVPYGNSTEKNAAMRAFGGEVIDFGADFDIARLEALRVADDEGLYLAPAFHKAICMGVATYALELFTAAPDIDTVYVPVGCGSGICSVITVRDLLGLKTKVVGVVSTEATATKQSFEAGRMMETETANTFADGVAVRVPVKDAFDIYARGAERFVAVSDNEVAAAIRAYFTDTHNVIEGAGAAPLAALMQERETMRGKTVAVIACGGNIDTALFADILAGNTPKVG